MSYQEFKENVNEIMNSRISLSEDGFIELCKEFARKYTIENLKEFASVNSSNSLVETAFGVAVLYIAQYGQKPTSVLDSVAMKLKHDNQQKAISLMLDLKDRKLDTHKLILVYLDNFIKGIQGKLGRGELATNIASIIQANIGEHLPTGLRKSSPEYISLSECYKEMDRYLDFKVRVISSYKNLCNVVGDLAQKYLTEHPEKKSDGKVSLANAIELFKPKHRHQGIASAMKDLAEESLQNFQENQDAALGGKVKKDKVADTLKTADIANIAKVAKKYHDFISALHAHLKSANSGDLYDGVSKAIKDNFDPYVRDVFIENTSSDKIQDGLLRLDKLVRIAARESSLINAQPVALRTFTEIQNLLEQGELRFNPGEYERLDVSELCKAAASKTDETLPRIYQRLVGAVHALACNYLEKFPDPDYYDGKSHTNQAFAEHLKNVVTDKNLWEIQATESDYVNFLVVLESLSMPSGSFSKNLESIVEANAKCFYTEDMLKGTFGILQSGPSFLSAPKVLQERARLSLKQVATILIDRFQKTNTLAVVPVVQQNGNPLKI